MANPNPSPATRFKKGNPGGPGAPRGPRWTTKLIHLIEESGAEKAILKVWLKAILEGDYRYFKEFLERVDGKVIDAILNDDGNGQPPRINPRKSRAKPPRPRSKRAGGDPADRGDGKGGTAR